MTPEQRDGLACIVCAERGGAMAPIARLDGCQLWAHRDGCIELAASVLAVEDPK